MAKFMHPPFADKQCDICHAPAKNGKVVLTQADVKSLCVTCHSEKADQIEKAKVQHPGAAGDCTDCHSPHASRQPGLPKDKWCGHLPGLPYRYCRSRQETRASPARLRAGLRALAMSRTATITIICCGPASPTRSVWSATGPTPGRRSWRANTWSPSSTARCNCRKTTSERCPDLPLEYGVGHPVEHHPVSDLVDPNDRTKVVVPLNCLTCHQPHASAQPDLLVKDQVNNMDFCHTCHKGLIGK